MRFKPGTLLRSRRHAAERRTVRPLPLDAVRPTEHVAIPQLHKRATETTGFPPAASAEVPHAVPTRSRKMKPGAINACHAAATDDDWENKEQTDSSIC